MGIKLPTRTPILGDTDLFAVSVIWYTNAFGTDGCAGQFAGRVNVNRTGSQIKAYLSGGHECVNGQSISNAGPAIADKITQIEGPI